MRLSLMMLLHLSKWLVNSDGTDAAVVAAGIPAIAEGTFSASANATKLVFTTGVSEAAASATAKMTLSSPT